MGPVARAHCSAIIFESARRHAPSEAWGGARVRVGALRAAGTHNGSLRSNRTRLGVNSAEVDTTVRLVDGIRTAVENG